MNEALKRESLVKAIKLLPTFDQVETLLQEGSEFKTVVENFKSNEFILYTEQHDA